MNMQSTMSTYLLIASGGALGAMGRFYAIQLADSLFGKHFPFGTLSVNVIGAFLLAIVYGLVEREYGFSQPLRYFAGVGILGAFTTFSTFSLETLVLLQNGLLIKALISVALNVFVCLLAAWAGVILMKG